MKVEEIKNKDLDIEWKVTIPSNNIDTELEKKYLEILNNVKIPGFRPGKIPIDVIKKRYAKSVIPDVIDRIINEKLKEEITKKKIKPSVQPQVKIENYEEGKDLVFNVNFQIMPKIDDIDFKKIKLEKSILKVSVNDIQNTMNDLAKKHERFIPLPRPRKSKISDLILFDYEGKIGGKDFESNSGKDETVVLGSQKYIPGYEEQMVGLGVNDSKEIEVTFPADYRIKKIAGKKAKFQIKIKDIQEKVENVPVDDQLAKELGEKDLVTLKEKIQEKMKADFNNLSMLKMRREASEELIKKCNFKIPTKMIDQEAEFLKKQSVEKKDTEIQKMASRRVKLGLIINSIGEENNVLVENSDLTKVIVEEAKKYPGREKEVVDFYKTDPSMMSNLRGVALEEKVMNFVVNSCMKSNVECTMDDLFKSDFLKQEKETISANKKEKKK